MYTWETHFMVSTYVPCRIGDFSEEVEWLKLLALCCTVLEKVLAQNHFHLSDHC